jgi:deoxyribonuclease IV
MSVKMAPRQHPCLGAHMSISGGPAKALERGYAIGCEAIQMFVRSPSQWRQPELTDGQVAAFHAVRQETGIQAVVSHAMYLINLAGSDEALWQHSLDTLVDELRRCARLGITDHVLHPGSHKGAGVEAGLERIATGLQAALDATAGTEVRILLEITAGQGDSLGHTLEELAWLREHVHPRERIGVCFDTAHALAAGYEFRDATSYATFWATFDGTLGLDQLRAMHLNDSKKPLGSRVDRHEQIGQGHMGVEAFRLLMNDPALAHVPMILETPKGDDLAEDVVNLALLRSLFDE